MTADNLSQKVSELSERLDELQTKCVSDPANAPEVLSDALESLQASIEELSSAGEELTQHNEESIEPAKASTDALALVQELQVHQIELKMQNEELKRLKLETEIALERYSDLYDFSPIGLFTLDEKRHILEVNVAGAELLGVEKRNLLNKHFGLFIAPEDRLSFDSFYNKALETSTRQTCELCLLRNEVPTVYAQIEGMSTRGHKLNGRQCRIAVSDITKRKKGEESLRTASAYNQNLIEVRLDPLVTIGPDGKITDVNAATEAVTGYGRGDLIGTDFSDYFTEPDKARACYQQVFENGFVRDYALEIRHKDGRLTDVLYNASVYKDIRGKVLGVFAAARDVTERKRAENELDKYRKHLEELVQERTYELEDANAQLQAEITERKLAEEALRESEKKYRTFIETANEGIWIIDAEARTTYVNEKIAKMLGFEPEEIIGKCSFDFMDEENRAASELRLKERKRGIKSNPEVKYIRKDGTPLWTISSVTPLTDKSGEFAGALGMVTDITERKLMEEELRHARDELELRVQERTADLTKAKEAAEAAVEAKAAFLANMSHELRTPLNAVIGFSSLLLDDNLTQDQKEDIERIRTGGEALLALISDILEFSRAEKEKITLEHQPLSLKASIEESMGMVAAQANNKGLNLAYTVAYGTPDTIISDPGRLRQILANLLSNAVKFTDAGDISVSVSSKSLEGNKRQITFKVMDTGIGMPQDKMDRLFQPFEQLEYNISRKRDGAGLGLAISKRLVELMGGEIWAESIEGKGSTFRFTIPAETIPGKQLDLSEKDKAAVYENLSAQKSLAILVAEDNPSNQRVLVEMLKRLGYRPDAVADGCEVLQALQIRPYDLLFMDIQMPEMDGLTATREIRKLWPDNGPKVIAITAFAMDGDREKCLEAGMDDYIAKPVKLGELAEVLKKYA